MCSRNLGSVSIFVSCTISSDLMARHCVFSMEFRRAGTGMASPRFEEVVEDEPSQLTFHVG